MNRLTLSLAPLLAASSATTAAPAPQKMFQIIPRVEIPVNRSFTPVRRLSCFFTPLASGRANLTIRNVGSSTYVAGSHIILLADDTTFIQFDLPNELPPRQTFVNSNMELQSTAKVCVAAHIQVNLVAAPPLP